ncbi:hypothetical protein JCM8097_004282 [Rhodosporidiobolus ruineniae]
MHTPAFLVLFTVFLSLLALVVASPSLGDHLDLSSNNKRMRRALKGSAQVRRAYGKGYETVEKRSSSGGAVGEAELGEKKMKRACYYVGTFFHLIDCNAPVNSTSIPFAPAQPKSTSSAPAATAVPVSSATQPSASSLATASKAAKKSSG